jgi:hypothetical protein
VAPTRTESPPPTLSNSYLELFCLNSSNLKPSIQPGCVWHERGEQRLPCHRLSRPGSRPERWQQVDVRIRVLPAPRTRRSGAQLPPGEQTGRIDAVACASDPPGDLAGLCDSCSRENVSSRAMKRFLKRLSYQLFLKRVLPWLLVLPPFLWLF